MTDKNLEKTMRKEWEDVRKGFYYPQLPQPKLVDNIPNAYCDIKNLEIKVSEPFILNFKEKGIEEAEALNEILTHELTHFMKYPGSPINILRMQKEGRKYADENRVNELRTAFTEMQTNTYLVKEKKHSATVKMRRIIQPDDNDSFGKLMYGLYQEVWEEDLGIKLSKEEISLIKDLKEIDYINKKTELDNFGKFVRILKDYQPKQEKNKSSKQGNTPGQCQGNGLDIFSENQIKEGIKQFAQECDNPKEFENIVKEILNRGNEESKDKTTYGINPGTGKGIFITAENFYSALAENYAIPIRKKPLHKNGSLYPHSHNSFSVSDSLNDLDSFSTPGILPGITKKWVKKEGEVATNFESTPNSILAIDNSGSMPNPNEIVSIPVLGATAISNAYLDNSSKVAVYNFGGGDDFKNLTTNKEEVHKALRKYTGGGTVFNSQFLENILKENQEEFDISVVSDMAISNFDNFIKTILRIPKIHRIHLIYTNNEEDAMKYVNKLKSQFGNDENIAILPLFNKDEINKIIMGEIKKSIN